MKLKIVHIVLLLLSSASLYAQNTEDKEVQAIADDIIDLVSSAKDVVFANQPLINAKLADKESLFAEGFMARLEEQYELKHQRHFSDSDHPYKTKLIEAMLKVMDSNQALINDPDVAYKGFIPAVFTSQLKAYFSNSGLAVDMHWTAPDDLLFNPLNRADQWERVVMERFSSGREDGRYYETVGTGAKKEFRVFSPLYYDNWCLSCHGLTENYVESRSIPFPSTGGQLHQFAGGISLSLNYQKVQQTFNRTRPTVRVAVTDYHYHSVIGQGEAFGRWVAFLDYLSDIGNVNFELVDTLRQRIKGELLNGTVDMAFPLYEYEMEGLSKVLDEPVLYETPGLCFVKDKFEPFPSLTRQWKNKTILYPGGMDLIYLIKEYGANLVPVVGQDVIDRGMNMLKLNRADAFYVSDTHSVYFLGSPYYREIACSGFHGFASPLYVASGPSMPPEVLILLKHLFKRAPTYGVSAAK